MMKVSDFRVTSFEDAAKQLKGKDHLTLCSNTRLIRRYCNLIAVRYHDTDIVLYDSTGGISINSGGWRTSSTKQRINRCLPPCFKLYQKRGVWMVQCWYWTTSTNNGVIFKDGMELVG